MNPKETIRAIPIFAELSVEQLRSISAISKVKSFKKGKTLFLEGETYFGFYILLKGLIKVYNLTKDGRESVIHIVNPVNIFADVPLFEGSDYPVSAEALVDSITLFIPKENFIELLKNDSEITLKMLGGFAKRMRSLVSQIEDLTTKEVVNRAAKYLVKAVEKTGSEKQIEPVVRLSAPKSVIASYLGTITETFSRTLHKLQKDGIIRVHGNKIFITDYPALKKLSSE
jgi:CRP/FNR family transcriptional regulator